MGARSLVTQDGITIDRETGRSHRPDTPVIVLSMLQPNGALFPAMVESPASSTDEPSIGLLQVAKGGAGINIPVTRKTLARLEAALVMIRRQSGRM